jgi:hypothetical protein
MVNRNFIDLTGQRFGELVALSYNKGTKHNHSTWTCKCSCGNEIDVPGYALRAGTYKSCGCKRIAKRDKGVRRHIEQDRVDGTRKSALKSKLHKGNKSGVKGVMWFEQRNCWKAYITIAGKTKHLGHFKDKEDAIKARKEAEEIYHKPILEDKNEND